MMATKTATTTTHHQHQHYERFNKPPSVETAMAATAAAGARDTTRLRPVPAGTFFFVFFFNNFITLMFILCPIYEW